MIGTDVAHVVFAHLYVKKLYFPLSLNANLRNSAVENHFPFGIYEENIEIF